MRNESDSELFALQSQQLALCPYTKNTTYLVVNFFQRVRFFGVRNLSMAHINDLAAKLDLADVVSLCQKRWKDVECVKNE